MGPDWESMMAVTPFLKLQKPPFNDIPWDEAINGNMDTIDAFIANFMAMPNYTGQWLNNNTYLTGQTTLDISNGTIYQCRVTHTSSPSPTTFSQDRVTFPGNWLATSQIASSAIVITVSDTAPATSKIGDMWFDSVGTQLYIRYSDGNSIQWVVTTNVGSSTGEAPLDGHTYARRNGAWIQIA